MIMENAIVFLKEWQGLAVVFTIIGGLYIFLRNLRTDIREPMEKRMDKMDERWHELLKEIHSLDKKIYKLELKREK